MKYPNDWSPKTAKEYFDETYPGEIAIDGETIVLRLDHDTAEWIASSLDRSDGFTNALWWYVYELKKAALART